VHDLGSANGTLLNGEPVRSESLVRCGDTLEIGSVVFEVQYVQPENPPGAWDQDSDLTVVDSSVKAELDPTDEAEPAAATRRYDSTADTIADEPTLSFRTVDDDTPSDEEPGDTDSIHPRDDE
jgi:pSer/pThr/pTyr-binding forkhead associated (FHA) protein